MVGLETSARDDTVAALPEGVRQEELQLTHLEDQMTVIELWAKVCPLVRADRISTEESTVHTLFPLRVLPVMSSLLTDTWNPLGTPGRSQGWIGVGRTAN